MVEVVDVHVSIEMLSIIWKVKQQQQKKKKQKENLFGDNGNSGKYHPNSKQASQWHTAPAI